MRRVRGLAIVECLVAMTILSATVLVTCYTLAAGQQHIYYGNRISTAVRLGRDLLEEATGRDYRERADTAVFGPEPDEESRAAFDDVDDYHDFTEAAGSLADAAGVRYPAPDQVFRREVSVVAVTENVPELGHAFAGLTVTVTVVGPGGQRWSFSRLLPEPGL